MDHDTYEFWYGKSIEEHEESVEQSIIALSRRCLLYTSPSPRDGLLSRMPSSA